MVAEGVEDRATWDRLAQMRCDYIQGYYVSRPVTADEIEGLSKKLSLKETARLTSV